MGIRDYDSSMGAMRQGVALALFFTSLGAAAVKPPNAQQVLAEAKAQATREHKNIFLLFGASW